MQLGAFIGRDRARLLGLADAIGVSPTSIYRYIAGDRIPRPDIMRAIERETAGQVRPADFYMENAA